MAETVLHVEVVSADRVVWSGEATQIIARTTEGDTGILANHSPMLAVLVPSGVEVFSTDGNREIVAVGGGFVSVQNNRVSILSEYATLGAEISQQEAERMLTDARNKVEQGDDSEETRRELEHAQAQLHSARKAEGRSSLI